VHPKAAIGAESQYLANIKAITNGGTNAEAYWSFDGKHFSFQAIRGKLAETHPCDQVYVMNADGSNVTLVAPGTGRDTCSYYFPDGKNVIFSMTSDSPYCPPTPDMNFGYVWPIYKDMDIYVRNLQTLALKRMTANLGYNAESTISPDGKRIIFTSSRSGDLELYTMNLDGSDVRRMTYTPGYDGGAYFSFDNSMFCWRANRPQGAGLTEYVELLDLGLVKPDLMQIMVQNVSLAEPAIQLTNNQGTNFAPFFLPDDSGVIFSSNLHNPMGGDFQLYTVGLDGKTVTQITTEGNFNSFPMFSPDGKKIAWCSDRGTSVMGEINVFVADWIGPGRRI